jgi:putative ABC transport system substrate-binding protein
MIGRREFIAGLGSAAAAWPLAARAQQVKLAVIGFLDDLSDEQDAAILTALRQGMTEVGYVEGRNVAIEYRWAAGQNDQLRPLADDLVRRRVDVIVAASITAALAAKSATATIPIVFEAGGDPVEFGLVASLNKPGGNITGVSSLNVQLGPKRLELLHELVPTATVMALLVNRTNQNAEAQSKNVQAAASSLGLKLHTLYASTESDLDTAFSTLVQLRATALLIGADPFFNSQRERLSALAARHAVPTICGRDFGASCLMSYGGGLTDSFFRIIGVYVGRILKGERPGDLPVQQSTKVELIINLKTAKALGLTFPLTLLGRADEVIE